MTTIIRKDEFKRSYFLILSGNESTHHSFSYGDSPPEKNNHGYAGDTEHRLTEAYLDWTNDIFVCSRFSTACLRIIWIIVRLVPEHAIYFESDYSKGSSVYVLYKHAIVSPETENTRSPVQAMNGHDIQEQTNALKEPACGWDIIGSAVSWISRVGHNTTTSSGCWWGGGCTRGEAE